MCRNERPKGAEKPRRQACSTGRSAASPGLGGNPNQRFRNIQKDIPKTLLAYVSGMFSSLILHYGLEYSYTLIFDMATGNLNGFTVECEYNVDWSG